MTVASMPLATAKAAADWLVQRLGVELVAGGPCVVGAIRREAQAVNSIELLLPMPAGHEQSPRRHVADELHDRIARLFALPVESLHPRGLFEPFEYHEDPPRAIGWHVEGLRPGFRRCELRLYSRDRTPETAVQVVLHRYVPGGDGNYGWQLMLTTGPATFIERMQLRWERTRGRVPGKSHPATLDGFPVDHKGEPVRCPDEEAAFGKCRCPLIKPKDRSAEQLDRRVA